MSEEEGEEDADRHDGESDEEILQREEAHAVDEQLIPGEVEQKAGERVEEHRQPHNENSTDSQRCGGIILRRVFGDDGIAKHLAACEKTKEEIEDVKEDL